MTKRRKDLNPVEIGERASQLLRDFRAHDVAHGNFMDTIVSICRRSSSIGRMIYRGGWHHHMTLIHLNSDFCWLGDERGGWRYERIEPRVGAHGLERIDILPSIAAREMMACALSRPAKRRLLPSSPKIEEALQGYLAEEIGLLRRAEALFEDAYEMTQSEGARRWAQRAAKDRESAEKLKGRLAAEGSCSALKAQRIF